MPTLEAGPDLILKPLQETDAPALFAVIDRNRVYLGEYLPFPDKTTEVEQSLEFIRHTQQEWQVGTGAHFGIFYQGELVGHMSLMHIQPGLKAEIGYWLSEHVGGQGLMTRATQALVRYAFDELHLMRLVIVSRTTNVRSEAIPKRLGFQFEGVDRSGERHGDKFYDFNRYSLLATDRPS